jgi:parvulin-like peptidyl-prolyl isomerase
VLPVPQDEVGAQLQGLLALLALAACSASSGIGRTSLSPPAAASRANPSIATAPPSDASAPLPVMAPPRVADVADELGPGILRPRADAPDAEVARIGDLVLRQSHVYTRLLSAHPKLVLSAVDLLVFDVLVANDAERFGIRVDPQRVEQLAAAEEAVTREQVKAELGAEMDLAGYVWRLFGLPEAEWARTLRLQAAQRLYQGYVIRYRALREDRAQVRFLVHRDQAIAQEVATKAAAGADFATLALRHSEDASKRDGGLLPPFGRGFQHPVAATAFTLEKGQVSAPFQASWGNEQRWFVVWCLDRLPGRDVPFAAVRDEIDRDLVDRPISPIETMAYTLRWRPPLTAPRAAVDAADR